MILVRYRPDNKSRQFSGDASKTTKIIGSDKEDEPTLWFCGNYNRNKCDKVGPHEYKARSKQV